MSKLEVRNAEIPDVKIIVPLRHADERGFFQETYNRRTLVEFGIDTEFVQDNHSLSERMGTLRGLHFQREPEGQAKLVRVVRGAIFDVAVDIRAGSATFGRWVSAVISQRLGNQIYMPRGFAHGFCTLEPGTEVIYKVDAYYAPLYDSGIIWDDPDLGIDWPDCADAGTLSAKDRTLPTLRALQATDAWEDRAQGVS